MKTADKIRELISMIEVSDFSASQYFNAIDNDDNIVKIRVSNHSANACNNKGNTLSFVTQKNMIQKRNMLCNEFVLLNGDPFENWETLEDLLEYHDIYE